MEPSGGIVRASISQGKTLGGAIGREEGYRGSGPLLEIDPRACWREVLGSVAKQASARYTPEATTWVKIKNREYCQAVGREDFFDRRRT